MRYKVKLTSRSKKSLMKMPKIEQSIFAKLIDVSYQLVQFNQAIGISASLEKEGTIAI